MKKIKKYKKVGVGLALWVCFIALGGWKVQSATVTFDGGGGDYLFSNPTNWSANILPAAGDKVVVNATGTSAANPALVDPGFTISLTGNVNFQGTPGAYVKILSGATLTFGTLLVGNAAGTYGELTVDNGGVLYKPGDTGSIDIGLTSGKLTLNAGATAELPNLYLRGVGTMAYAAASTGLATANLYGDTAWLMDGLLKLDVTALSSSGTFVLIQHQNDNTAGESMTGNLRTWLNAGSGTQIGTGDSTFNVNGTNIFQVVGAGSKDWILQYSDASGTGVLSFSIIPEPATVGLMGVSGIGLLLLRRHLRR